MTELCACADCGCMYDTSELVECEEMDCERLVCHDCAIECWCCGKTLCWECESQYDGYCYECY